MNTLLQYYNAALDLFLPRNCILCRQNALHFETSYLCRRCSTHLFQPHGFSIESSKLTPRGIALGKYQGHLRHLIHEAKFKRRIAAIETLLELSAQACAELNFQPDCVTAVPGSFWRNLKRGVHLPSIIAKQISQNLRTPHDRKILSLNHRIPHQVGLSKKGREKNVKGAYTAQSRAGGLRVLVIDDVYTSGATARSIVQALQAVDVRGISFFFLAKT